MAIWRLDLKPGMIQPTQLVDRTRRSPTRPQSRAMRGRAQRVPGVVPLSQRMPRLPVIRALPLAGMLIAEQTPAGTDIRGLGSATDPLATIFAKRQSAFPADAAAKARAVEAEQAAEVAREKARQTSAWVPIVAVAGAAAVGMIAFALSRRKAR